jgi:hypothetical protein
MAKPRTFDAIKHRLADGKCFGKIDMTPPRDRVVPKEMKARSSAKPQFREDQALPGSSGDVPGNSWLRGAGEKATNRPFFDHSKKGR